MNTNARMFPNTDQRQNARWWARRTPPGGADTDLVLPDALSKTIYRDVNDKVRRYVRVLWLELPNEIGAALCELGFSSLVALELTSEAAMLLWSRAPTSSIPREAFDAALRTTSHVRDTA